MINNLSIYRKKSGLTQKEFAEKLEIGLGTLSKWENPNFDLNNLKVIQLNKICELLHIKIEDLIKEA